MIEIEDLSQKINPLTTEIYTYDCRENQSQRVILYPRYIWDKKFCCYRVNSAAAGLLGISMPEPYKVSLRYLIFYILYDVPGAQF